MNNENKYMLEDGYPNEDYYADLISNIKVNLMIKELNPELKDVYLYSAKELKEVSKQAIVTPSLVLINIDFLQKNDISNEAVINCVAELINAPHKYNVAVLENNELLELLNKKGFGMVALNFKSAIDVNNPKELEKNPSRFQFSITPEEVAYVNNLKSKELPDLIHDYIQLNMRSDQTEKIKLAKDFAIKLAEDIKDFGIVAYSWICYSIGASTINKAFRGNPNKNLSANELLETFAHQLNNHESCGNHKRSLMIEYITSPFEITLPNSQHNEAKLEQPQKKKKR